MGRSVIAIERERSVLCVSLRALGTLMGKEILYLALPLPMMDRSFLLLFSFRFVFALGFKRIVSQLSSGSLSYTRFRKFLFSLPVAY